MSQPAHGRTVKLLVGVVGTVVALTFAAVPLYSWFCRTTGYNGTAVAATGPAPEVLDRKVLVRFDANTGKGLPWEFRAERPSLELKLGETATVLYEASNPTDRTIAARAVFSVAPDAVGGFVTKVSCFCDDTQVLRPHERMELPVSFYVAPAMIDDEDGRYVTDVTLSYTYYETDLPAEKLTELVNARISGQQKTN